MLEAACIYLELPKCTKVQNTIRPSWPVASHKQTIENLGLFLKTIAHVFATMEYNKEHKELSFYAFISIGNFCSQHKK